MDTHNWENRSKTRKSKCFPTLSMVWEKHAMSSSWGKKNLTCSKAAWLTAAPSFMAARNTPGRIEYLTAKDWIRRWASSFAFKLLAKTWSLIRRCYTFHSSSTKRTAIARASPILVVPSKMTEQPSTRFLEFPSLSRWLTVSFAINGHVQSTDAYISLKTNEGDQFWTEIFLLIRTLRLDQI